MRMTTAAIRFRERGDAVSLPIKMPLTAARLVLSDAEGREHHFGCGQWDRNGEFVYLATYTSGGARRSTGSTTSSTP